MCHPEPSSAYRTGQYQATLKQSYIAQLRNGMKMTTTLHQERDWPMITNKGAWMDDEENYAAGQHACLFTPSNACTKVGDS